MSVALILRALANERRLQILEWLRDPQAHFPPQVDGDLVKDGVCGALIAEKLVPLHRGFDGLRWAALILHQSPWTRRCRGKREPAWPGPFGW